jgi:hypothetical protein
VVFVHNVVFARGRQVGGSKRLCRGLRGKKTLIITLIIRVLLPLGLGVVNCGVTLQI